MRQSKEKSKTGVNNQLQDSNNQVQAQGINSSSIYTPELATDANVPTDSALVSPPN